ncbi:ABC-three component system protein [Pseudomonas yangonensis]|uniref:ABC-three component system protein n=1 Tax=Pseudomonas yangonensis TaxID=2579922 RepID=UPI00137A6CD8|nr:ABC-three component system protein [Pseudomonas yangonensis]
MDNTEASASIAGYGFQFERALYRIFHSTHRKALFGIETTDDVAEIIPRSHGITSILEQDKHTRTDKNPVQDSSKNLWNSLKNWLNKLDGLKSEYAEIKFLLITNGSVPKTALAAKLSNAKTDEEIAEAFKALKAQAQKLTKEIKEIGAEVMSYDDESLKYVIANFELVHRMQPEDLREAIYTALQLPSHLEKHQDLILDNLTGRLFNDCLEIWRKKEPFWTTSDTYFTRKQLLFEMYSADDWTTRSQEDTEYKELMHDHKYLMLPFVEQLREIGIMDRTIEKEIGHYWATYSERSRLLKLGKVLNEDLDSLEEKFFKEWDGIREHYSNVESLPLEDFAAKDHKNIYLKILPPVNCEVSMGRLKARHPYFYHGTHHHQVNDDGTKYPIYWMTPGARDA